MNASKKWFFYSSFLALLLIFLIMIYLFNVNISLCKDYMIILTFVLIGIKTLKEILNDIYDYSINKVFWYFNFIFFFMAPLVQYLSNYVPMNYYIEERLYLKANCIILVWIYIYSFFSKITINKKLSNNITFNKNKIILNKKTLNILLLINIFIFIIMVTNIGIVNLFIREKNYLPNLSGYLNLIIDNGMRVIPVFSTIYSYYYTKYYNRDRSYIIIFIAIMFILNFPTSNTRYFVGVIYIGIIITIFKKYMKNRRFDIFFIILLFLVFPIFQIFKWYTFSDLLDGNININLDYIFNAFNNMDFDAYTMFQRIIAYTELEGYTFGNQILSTLLFLIPRNMWVNKPLPTGEFVAINQNSSFTNLSSPLISEAYIDFGILGIVIYAIILAKLINKLDKLYFNNNNKGLRYIEYIYPFALGFCIFIMRGALQPVVVFMFAFFLPLLGTKIFNLIKKSRI